MPLPDEFIIDVGGLEGEIVSVVSAVLGGEVPAWLGIELVALTGAVVESGGGGVGVASISSLSERFLGRVAVVVGEEARLRSKVAVEGIVRKVAGEGVAVLCRFRGGSATDVCSETIPQSSTETEDHAHRT